MDSNLSVVGSVFFSCPKSVKMQWSHPELEGGVVLSDDAFQDLALLPGGWNEGMPKAWGVEDSRNCKFRIFHQLQRRSSHCRSSEENGVITEVIQERGNLKFSEWNWLVHQEYNTVRESSGD